MHGTRELIYIYFHILIVPPLAEESRELMFQKGTKVPGSEAEGQPH